MALRKRCRGDNEKAGMSRSPSWVSDSGVLFLKYNSEISSYRLKELQDSRQSEIRKTHKWQNARSKSWWAATTPRSQGMTEHLPLNQKVSRTKNFSQKNKNLPWEFPMSHQSYAKKRPSLCNLPNLESSIRDNLRDNAETTRSLPRFRNSDTWTENVMRKCTWISKRIVNTSSFISH